MKFFAVFSAIVAVALASPTTWTIHELSEAIQNPSTDAALIPILEQSLNELMIQAISGNPQPVTTVSTSVQDFSSWTLHELSEAIQSPATSPALLPYLEHALNSLLANIMSGQQQESIIVGTPVGLLPVEVVVPVVPAPAETPVVPAEIPVAPEASPASPLVQIIVNIKSQEVAAPAPAAVPEVIPVLPAPALPVVVPNPVDIIAVNPETVLPEPVIVAPVIVPNPIDIIAINPESVVPEPVIIAPVIVPNPVDIIAVNPEVIVNPVDVVAISAPEVNPVDILSPMPVVTPVGAIDGVVGPIV